MYKLEVSKEHRDELNQLLEQCKADENHLNNELRRWQLKNSKPGYSASRQFKSSAELEKRQLLKLRGLRQKYMKLIERMIEGDLNIKNKELSELSKTRIGGPLNQSEAINSYGKLLKAHKTTERALASQEAKTAPAA